MADADTNKSEPIAVDQATGAEVTENKGSSAEGKAESSECLCSELADALKAHPFYSTFAEVFLWRDLIRSALVFVIFNFYFFLICIAEYSVVTLSSYLALALIGASVAYSKFLTMKGSPKNFIEERVKETDFGLAPAVVEQSVKSVHKLLEVFRKFALRIFSANDLVLTVEVAASLLVISQVAKLLSGFGLIYAITLVLFVWPRLYEEKKDLIDAQYAKISAQIMEKVGPVLAKLPLPKSKKD